MDFKEPLTFGEFNKTSYEGWKAQALKELKKDNLDSLQWKNIDHITHDPYYDPENAIVNNSFHHRVNIPNDYAIDARWWENRQEIALRNPSADNKLILEALEGGADGVLINFISSNDLSVALKNVKPEYCSISFNIQKEVDLNSVINFLMEPGHKGSVNGDIYWEDVKSAVSFIKEMKWKQLPEKIRCLGITPEQGKDEIVSLLVATNKILEAASPTDRQGIANRFAWRISVGQDYFQGIATVKALRHLLFQIFSAYNIDVKPEGFFIYAYSPVYKNEDFGPHENMLKATTAGMAAVIGGCNAIYIEPQDMNSPMQRRIARNVPLILKEEAYLGKNLDPVAGSYFLELMLEKTCKIKWQKFQELV